MKLKICKPEDCQPYKKENGTISFPPSYCYDVELDGKSVGKSLKSVQIDMKAWNAPEATLTFALDELEVEGDFPEIKVRKGQQGD